jgi:hypothetical protein
MSVLIRIVTVVAVAASAAAYVSTRGVYTSERVVRGAAAVDVEATCRTRARDEVPAGVDGSIAVDREPRVIQQEGGIYRLRDLIAYRGYVGDTVLVHYTCEVVQLSSQRWEVRDFQVSPDPPN